jgi:hypothetical protein
VENRVQEMVERGHLVAARISTTLATPNSNHRAVCWPGTRTKSPAPAIPGGQRLRP